MKTLKQLMSAVALSILVSTAVAQTTGTCATNTTNITTCNYAINDDGYAIVPIPFGFPYYGKLFTHSIFFDNGIVSFYTPDQDPQRLGGQNYYAEPLSNNINSQFYYSIMPLWTDLRNYSGSYFTETDGLGFLRYNWENISQFGYPNRLNTFGLEIRPSGYIGINYQLINITGYPITAGVVGDAALGEWTQHFRSEGTAVVTGGIANWSLSYTQPTDCSDPLSNPACPGYAEAYQQQQCTVNPLYSTSCPGYQQAYYDQQCSINPLYDSNCPGYATAYYDYQCSADPLYHTGCSGYQQAYFDQQCNVDPLYNNQCTGYQQAYFDQQCGLNGLYSTSCPNYADAFYVQQCTISPLYDSGCTGYEQAYFDQQCSINSLYSTSCPGYATAFFNQQCSLDPLYNNQCPGYATAFFNQQCSISALYNIQCPGYAEAYFSQQCSLDGLYSNQCPNYAEAYAKKNILNIGSTTPIAEPVVIASTTADQTPQLVADPVVNQAITAATTSVSSATAATAIVPLAPAPQAVATTTATETKKEETKTEAATSTAVASSSDKKDEPKTSRQALAERRLEAARAKAVEEGKQLAGKMGEAATIEAQIQVQGVVLAAMGFVPGFDNYNKAILPDAVGYRPFEIYRGQQNTDNPAGRRFLTGADRLHQEMVDSQYRLTGSE